MNGDGSAAALEKMPDDNSCLFHAVSFLLSPWSSTQELRQTVVQSVELAIFAENLEAEISVTDVQSGRADVYGSGQGFPRRIYMLFSGIHFDAVVVEGLRTVPTTATARIARADALVAALATEQRACGGYTDQATMVLMCAACGQIVHGEKEARRHAGSFGHKDFVQPGGYS
ncbi:ubiquitin thioesterase otu1-like protein [Chrysochromulina tobinii]|uniref:Ubiquitin thioesterase OTU n=1 Tax=Chrysochromulina tobinii TaxID=1460289 RepID=A0A0M0JKA8_9EUKA|nr:ubiquitin thioesterase otu1-like protein [Chrysochromulina tobinii]|eukprot:KOO26777.1 ubiquitin thioesterase otu1-like protein [Chrysochromulina sp. CCMP291]